MGAPTPTPTLLESGDNAVIPSMLLLLIPAAVVRGDGWGRMPRGSDGVASGGGDDGGLASPFDGGDPAAAAASAAAAVVFVLVGAAAAAYLPLNPVATAPWAWPRTESSAVLRAEAENHLALPPLPARAEFEAEAGVVGCSSSSMTTSFAPSCPDVHSSSSSPMLLPLLLLLLPLPLDDDAPSATTP